MLESKWPIIGNNANAVNPKGSGLFRHVNSPQNVQNQTQGITPTVDHRALVQFGTKIGVKHSHQMEVTSYTFLFLLQVVNMLFIYMTSNILQIAECMDHRKDLALRTKLDVATYLNYVLNENENARTKVTANYKLESIIDHLAQDNRNHAHKNMDDLIKYAYANGHLFFKDGDNYVRKHFPQHLEVQMFNGLSGTLGVYP